MVREQREARAARSQIARRLRCHRRCIDELAPLTEDGALRNAAWDPCPISKSRSASARKVLGDADKCEDVAHKMVVVSHLGPRMAYAWCMKTRVLILAMYKQRNICIPQDQAGSGAQ